MKYNFFSLQQSLISDNVISLKYESILTCRVHDLICNIAKYFYICACLSLSIFLSHKMPKSFHKSISKVVYQVYEGIDCLVCTCNFATKKPEFSFQ